MRLPEIGSSSSTQPTKPPPAHDTSSTGAKAFETTMYAAKGATSFSAPTNSRSPGRPIPPGGAYGNAAPGNGQSPRQGGPPPGPGYALPTGWNAVSPSGSGHSGTDPFNIIISGNSNVTLPQLVQGLEAVPHPTGGPEIPVPDYSAGMNRFGPNKWTSVPAQWAPVGTAAGSSLARLFGEVGENFTGAELADVQPPRMGQLAHPVQQQLNMRVGRTNTTYYGNINHFRLYQQQRLPGDHQGAYFIAASVESFHYDFPALWNSYHDVASNGFNQGGENLLDDIKTAAKMQGWNMQVYQIQAEPPAHGSNGVPYDGKTYVVTLTHASG